MRRVLSAHAPTWAALAVMVLVFVGFAAVIGPGLEGPPLRSPATAATPIDLPPPQRDADNDTYADDVDLWDGDLLVTLNVTRLALTGGPGVRPYFLVGTQDDHWRTGKDAELEWLHVVDHDPLGHRAGSPEWIDASLRTGMWWRSLPMEGESHTMARGPSIESGQEEARWPQRFFVNTRDDRAGVTVELEAWDAARNPHVVRGSWTFQVDAREGRWRLAGDEWIEPGERVRFGGFGAGETGLEVSLDLASDVDPETKRELAARWAPHVLFTDGEQFFPTRGEALEDFHGFSNREADHRTWVRTFNNGRDGYRLLLADFTGDGSVGHDDARLLYGVLRAGEVGRDTVYANVMHTTGGQVVVQYWFFYVYNYMLDETGRDVSQLAHAGDREFMHLVFEDLDAARNGTPLRTAYSQHYDGVVVPYEPGEPPFHLDADRPAVFVSLGGHASYPSAGTDEAKRHSLQGFGDVFLGDGEVWDAQDYEVEVLGTQSWHAGYKWGPFTRHSRDIGVSARPLLQYGFSYPFTDPLHWESSLQAIEADRLGDLYGGQR